MTLKMSKTKRILFYIAIMLSNVAVMGEQVIQPITYNFYNAFPDSQTAVNMILSIPLIMMIIFSIIAGKLCNHFNKKNLLIFGGVLFAIGSIFGLTVETIPYIIIMRAVTGIGEAFVTTVAVVFIGDVYGNEGARAKFLGIYNAVMALIGVVMSQAAGSLAVSKWENSFWVYWAAVPMVIAMILFLPSIQKTEDVAETRKGKKEPFGKAFWVMAFDYLIYNIAYGCIAYFISLYIVENGIGNEVFSGTYIAMCTAGSAVTCMIFGFLLYKYLGNKTAVLAYGMAAAAIAIHIFIPTKAAAIVGALLIGSSYGNVFSFGFAYAPMVVPKSRADEATGVASALTVGPWFISTYLMTWLMDGVFKTELVTPCLIVPLGMCVVAFVIELIFTGKYKRMV